MSLDLKDFEKQIERVKQEILLYLKLADKLHLSDKDIEQQMNKYLDTLNILQELKRKIID